MGWSLCVDRLTSQIIQSYLVPVVLKYTRQCINNSLSCVDILSRLVSIDRTWQGLVHATRSAGPLPPSVVNQYQVKLTNVLVTFCSEPTKYEALLVRNFVTFCSRLVKYS
jgi:hypothetical protein